MPGVFAPGFPERATVQNGLLTSRFSQGACPLQGYAHEGQLMAELGPLVFRG